MSAEEIPPAIKTHSRSLQQQHIFSFLQKSPSLKTLAQIHAQILTNGFSSKNFILVPLITLYSLHGYLNLSQSVFDKIVNPSTTSWNQIIRAQTARKSVELFARMQREGVEADGYTYSYTVSACSGFGMVREGEQVHGRVLASGYGSNLFVGTSLVNFYGYQGEDCGAGDARRVFNEMSERNVVTWNTMLAGFFRCGDVDGAVRVFDEMPERNLLSWTTMVSGCARLGRCAQALSLFQEMRRGRVGLDQVALISALSACAELGNLELGRWIHSYVDRSFDGRRHEIRATLNNALIHMYASCGVLEEANEVFKDMPIRNTVSWTSMIMGYAKHGYAEEALRLFEGMRNMEVEPDDVTFIGVLMACSHAGFVDKGQYYFEEMKEKWSIEPRLEHYGCMVDLLSRVGLLDEAYSLVESMPMKPNDAIWGALIGGCRIHRNTDLVFHAAQNLTLQQDTEKAMGYLALMSHAYTMAKRWEDVVRVRQEMIEMDIGKPLGRSWVQINGAIHDFTAGDQSHKHASSIYDMLGNLTWEMKYEEHQSDIYMVPVDFEQTAL